MAEVLRRTSPSTFLVKTQQVVDNRSNKLHRKSPDLRYETAKEALWINSGETPQWVLQVDCLKGPVDWWENRKDKLHLDSRNSGHRSTKEGLWIDNCNTPEWLTEALEKNPLYLKDSRSILTSSRKGSPEIAADLKSPKHNEYSWTALISQHAKCGQGRQAFRLYEDMRNDGVQPSPFTFVALLKACSSMQDLESAKRIHAEVVANGFESDIYVGTMLVDAYAKCGSLVDARHVFEKMPRRNVVSWTAMILGYAQLDAGEHALQMYSRMQHEGVVPDGRTYVSVLKACSTMAESEERNEGEAIGMKKRSVETVRSIHSDIVRRKFESDVFVGTMVVDLYAKCGSLEDARLVFERMPHRTVVSWNAMILGYAEMDNGEEALHLFTRMQQEGVVPDSWTYVSALKACSTIAELGESNPGDSIAVKEKCLETVRSIHKDIENRKFELNVFVGTMLVDVYAKCASLENSRQVFEKMAHRDVVSWTAMIWGYAQMDKGEEALRLYTQMQGEGVVPNERTYVGALNACGSVAGLEKGKEIHAQILKAGFEAFDCFLTDGLIDMYGKCGSMVDAQKIFDGMRTREVVAWNALIAGYVHQGDSESVFDLFHRMLEEGLRPDGITFLGVLTVCSHVGLVDRGETYFQVMSRDYGIVPTIKHFTCMIDLLGRAGHLERAMKIVKAMPFQPNSAVWGCVLGACQKWGKVELGRQAFECALRLNKDDAAAYVLMSNIYATAGKWQEAKNVQAMRVQIRGWKEPGRSRWTDVSGIAHVFTLGDPAHPESQHIYAKLRDLLVEMKKAGYVPHLDSVLQGIPGDDKEDALCGHSEGLAVAYALLKTPAGTTIRVVKNLRVCEDCHMATAFISRIEQRTIVCRDANRFHVYKDGKCSCGGYW